MGIGAPEARPGTDSALDGTGEAADDAALEQREEHQRRDHRQRREREHPGGVHGVLRRERLDAEGQRVRRLVVAVSYTHLRAHETVLDLVCRLLLEKKK